MSSSAPPRASDSLRMQVDLPQPGPLFTTYSRRGASCWSRGNRETKPSLELAPKKNRSAIKMFLSQVVLGHSMALCPNG